MADSPRHIAMWSGPRNISTAMMRSWGNRHDTYVCDEPFYAHYLHHTGYDHPGREEIIEDGETDPDRVIAWLTGDIPQGRTIFYQKHMAHHLLPHMDRTWLDRVTNAFLIREPREMLTSLIKILPEPSVSDTGLPQQVEIFNQVREKTGETPPVLDAKDTLDDPRRLLGLLAESLGLDCPEAMFSWPKGPRDTDGIWAKHWYSAVEESTTFQPYRPKPDPVPESMTSLLAECEEHYRYLYQHRLGA